MKHPDDHKSESLLSKTEVPLTKHTSCLKLF